MKRSQEIKMTEDELQQEREEAATLAAREVIKDMQEEIDSLRAVLKQAAVSRDVVPEHLLLDWLGVSRRTLKRWDVPVDSRKGQTRLYHMPTVIEHLREEGQNTSLNSSSSS